MLLLEKQALGVIDVSLLHKNFCCKSEKLRMWNNDKQFFIENSFRSFGTRGKATTLVVFTWSPSKIRQEELLGATLEGGLGQQFSFVVSYQTSEVQGLHNWSESKSIIKLFMDEQ